MKALGFDDPSEFGIHALQKGVSTHLESLPMGPSLATMSIRGAWSIGTVKDIYFDHSQVDNEFCGQFACLLNIMEEKFSITPVHWNSDTDKDLL